MAVSKSTGLIAGSLVLLAIAYWQGRVIAPVPLPQAVTGWNADLYNIYVPAHTFAYRSPRLWPAWNPYQLAGTPFLANYNVGFFYPPNLLSAVLPVNQAIGYGSALHVGLAGVLTLLAANALALSPPAATLSAIGFMLSSFFLIERIHPSYLAGLAWIPGVFLAAGLLAARPTAWSGVRLGIILALQIVAGHAQIVCYELYVLLLLAAIHLGGQFGRSAQSISRTAAALAIAAVVAVLLAAVQLLPTLEVLGRAVRGVQGLSLEQTMPGQPSWSRLRDFACGAGPVVLLALLGPADRRRQRVVAIAILVLACTVLVGLGTPAYTRFFFHLPGVGLFRLPQTILYIGLLALALLAGVGLDATIAPGPARIRTSWLGGLGGAIVLLSAGWPPDQSRILAGAVLACAGLAAVVPRAAGRTAIGWLVVLLVVVALWLRPGGTLMMPQHNASAFFEPPPVVHFLRERSEVDRVLVIKNWGHRFPIMEKLGTLYRIPVVQDYEPLTAAAYHDFLRPLELANSDRPLFWGRVFPRPIDLSWRLLDMLAVRHVVVAPGAYWPGESVPRFRAVYAGPDARVYENTASLPRAFLVSRHRVEPDAAATLAALHAPTFDPLTEALVDREVTWASDAREVPVPQAVRITKVTEDSVTLDVATPRRVLLVLADLHWPGWHVAVDEAERSLYRVNHLFRGAAIEPGTHAVRFWYEPVRLKLGVAITAATILTLLGAAALSWRRPVKFPRRS